MKQRQTISDITKCECTGCGLCAGKCSKNAISMKFDNHGFLYPFIDADKCVSCGICYDTCPTRLSFINKPHKCYSFYLNNKEELLSSASGGVASAIAAYTVGEGGIVYGVCYSENYRSVEFRRIDSEKGLDDLKGAKYAEPIPPSYKQLLADVKSGRKVAFFGLPCHIAAAKSMLKLQDFDNVYLCALMCLGKASLRLYHNFVAETELKYKSRITHVNMRWKKKDWNNSFLRVDFSDGGMISECGPSSYLGLLSHEFFRPSCYDCKFKLANASEDILIGDFWGAEYLAGCHNKYGTSAIITFNEKSAKLLCCLPNSTLREVGLDDVLRTNGAICNSYHKPDRYDYFCEKINSGASLRSLCIDFWGGQYVFFNKIKYNLKSVLPDSLIRFVKRIKHR